MPLDPGKPDKTFRRSLGEWWESRGRIFIVGGLATTVVALGIISRFPFAKQYLADKEFLILGTFLLLVFSWEAILALDRRTAELNREVRRHFEFERNYQVLSNSVEISRKAEDMIQTASETYIIFGFNPDLGGDSFIKSICTGLKSNTSCNVSLYVNLDARTKPAVENFLQILANRPIYQCHSIQSFGAMNLLCTKSEDGHGDLLAVFPASYELGKDCFALVTSDQELAGKMIYYLNSLQQVQSRVEETPMILPAVRIERQWTVDLIMSAWDRYSDALVMASRGQRELLNRDEFYSEASRVVLRAKERGYLYALDFIPVKIWMTDPQLRNYLKDQQSAAEEKQASVNRIHVLTEDEIKSQKSELGEFIREHESHNMAVVFLLRKDFPSEKFEHEGFLIRDGEEVLIAKNPTLGIMLGTLSRFTRDVKKRVETFSHLKRLCLESSDVRNRYLQSVK